MKKFKRALAVTFAVLMLVSLTACTGGGTKKIGFSVYDMQYDYFQQMEKGTKEGVAALGYDYILHDEKSDESQMVSGATNLINQGIAALIISPNKPEALGPIVDAAKKKHIPVIIDDIGGGGTDYDVIVISDCFKGGQIAADYTLELLKGKEASKKVAIIKCEPSAVYAIRRGDGYKQNMVAAGFTVVKELSGHSKTEEGYSIMKDLLASDPDIVAVFAENDPMAVGAANALKDAGRTDVIVIGFNGDQVALDAMKAGLMQGTVAQDPYGMGKLTTQLADKLIKGEKLTFDNAAQKEIFAPVKLIKASDVK
jgi:ribose transport system substrate-binding protein